MEDQNVRMLVKDVFFAEEMLSAWLVIITLCVHVNKVLLMMAKMVADELNVKVIKIVLRNVSVKRISVNRPVKLENHVGKKRFVQLKIIVPFAIVNQATVEILINIVMPLIIVEIHHAVQEPFARITKAHSIVLVVMVMLVMRIMKDVVWLSNVKIMEIAHRAPSAFNRIANRNAEMFVRKLVVDQIPSAFQSNTLLSVNVYRAMVVKQLI